MIYSFVSLRTAGLAVAILLILAHGWALLRGGKAQAWLKGFPRSEFAGIALTTVVAIWAFALIATMDLGEFTGYRRMLLFAIPIAFVLTVKFVDEFLAVRSLGMLLLLAAEPVLEAAFLRPEASRLLLVVLAYVWATAGIFYVAMPYLLRDHIGWITRSEGHWKSACLAGVAYGAALLVCAVTVYG